MEFLSSFVIKVEFIPDSNGLGGRQDDDAEVGVISFASEVIKVALRSERVFTQSDNALTSR
jgi:hypothetical protein